MDIIQADCQSVILQTTAESKFSPAKRNNSSNNNNISKPHTHNNNKKTPRQLNVEEEKIT